MAATQIIAMPSPVFPAPQLVGPSATALRPLLEIFGSTDGASVFSPRPDVHPGFVDPSWLPRKGTVSPKTSPVTITAPRISPGSVARGLGWGLVLSLAGAWLEDLDAQVKGRLDYRGEPYPETNDAQIGQVILAVGKACAATDAESKTMLAPQALPMGKRRQTQEDDKTQEPPMKRWKIFAHTRAGKRKP